MPVSIILEDGTVVPYVPPVVELTYTPPSPWMIEFIRKHHPQLLTLKDFDEP